MTKVIILSTKFPAYHPKAGQPTHFVESFLNCFSSDYAEYNTLETWNKLNPDKPHDTADLWSSLIDLKGEGIAADTKHNTIRLGNRWKAGDIFSPRVWSGKPYASKQIIITHDIMIEKVWNVRIANHKNFVYVKIDRGNNMYVHNDCIRFLDIESDSNLLYKLAKNDGLSVKDFCDWFPVPKSKSCKLYTGQIICWDKNIEY